MEAMESARSARYANEPGPAPVANLRLHCRAIALEAQMVSGNCELIERYNLMFRAARVERGSGTCS